MQDEYDVIIIGAGPAGLSAAATLFTRGKSAAIISNAPQNSPLAKAERVENYPGLSGVTGAELIGHMVAHAQSLGISIIVGRALNAMPVEGGFFVSIGSDFLKCGAIIIAAGIAQKSVFPGELEFLGRGVSYCATCDGMLYRGKKTAVVGLSSDAESEAEFLRGIGCEVEYFDKARAKKYEITGSDRVESLVADNESFPCDGVFILRDTVAVSAMLRGIETEDGAIKVSRDMSASIPGVFAAGDCTGKPHQIAKAVGEGNIAALSAAAYIDKNLNKHSTKEEI